MPSMKSKRENLKSATKPKKELKVSRTHAPADLSPLDWQRGLRRQFGREQAFGIENLTSESFFSEFRVGNPVSKSSYHVAIRGLGPGGNFCSCPDREDSDIVEIRVRIQERKFLTDRREGTSSCAEKICTEKSARYHGRK